ncbi:hypothetical protein [Endozoicomonas sp.]|uniref:hypothetical protein n=1 Tax=Endozoicomonas sp. TaxID=1892382 RepID=UPI003AF591E5
MTAFQKSKCFALAFSIFFPGVVLAAPDSLVKSTDISLSYLEKELFKGSISAECSDVDSVCHYRFEPLQNADDQNKGAILPINVLKFQGDFHHTSESSTDLGFITVHKDDQKTKIPLSIDFEELQLGNKDNPLTRAIITQLHPSLVVAAYKELNDRAEVSDYLIGKTKNSEVLHLFQPEKHDIQSAETNYLRAALSALHEEFLILDIGDSYSMVIVFDSENVPTSVHVLDRWKLYRGSAFKSAIGYGDLFGLVLHVLGAAHHIGIPIDGHHHTPPAGPSNFKSQLKSTVSFLFHSAEVIDHAHGVGEFISGTQKHYHDHNHGLAGDVFGIMHLGHTFYEWATERERWVLNSVQAFLTVASFGYHHVPTSVYEYSIAEILPPVIVRENKRAHAVR